MEYMKIGHTDIKASVITLGGMPMGGMNMNMMKHMVEKLR